MRPALRWRPEHEMLLLLVAAPLLIWPRPLAVLAGALLLGSARVAARRHRGRWLPVGVPGLPVAWLLASATLGFAITLDPERSLERVGGLLLGLGMLCAAAAWPRGRAATPFPGILIAGATALALATPLLVNWAAKRPAWVPPALALAWPATLQATIWPALDPLEYGVPANTVAGLLAILLPVALAGATRPALAPPSLAGASVPLGGGWRPRRAAALGMALIALALLATQARGAILAGGLASGAYLAWRAPRARPALAAAAIAGLIAGLTAFVGGHAGLLAAVLGGAHVDAQGDTALLRLALWERALSMIGDYPFTGVGLNNFPLVQQRLYPLLPVQPAALIPHAHNLYLQAALDYGVPGLLAFLALAASLAATIRPGLARPARGLPDLDAVILAGYAAGLVAYLLYGLTDALAVGGRLAAPAWLLAGLALGLAPLPQRPRRLSPGLRTAAWLGASLVVGTAVQAWFG